MSETTRRGLGQAGFTLPVSMLAMIVGLLLGLAVYSLMRAQTRETLYQARLAQAQAIAEAGAEDALLQLSLNMNWRLTVTKSFAGGSYTVSAADNALNPLNPFVYSTGYAPPIAGFGSAARSVSLQANAFGFQSFADVKFSVVNTTFTSYDSGLYREPDCNRAGRCGFGGHVWANDSVILITTSSRVDGNVLYANELSTPPSAAAVPAPGQVILWPSTQTVAIHDGSPYLAANDNLTRIADPGLPQKPYNPATMILSVTTATTGGSVVLSSGTFYFKGIYVSSRTLEIDLSAAGVTDEQVTIYLDGGLYVSPNGLIDSGNSAGGNACGAADNGCRPQNFIINCQGGGRNIVFNGYNMAYQKTDNFTFVDLWCPDDNISINQRVLGRAIGRNVLITRPPNLTTAGQRRDYRGFLFDSQFGYTSTSGAKWLSGSWSEGYVKP